MLGKKHRQSAPNGELIVMEDEIKQDPSITRPTPRLASIADLSRQHEFRPVEIVAGKTRTGWFVHYPCAR